MTVTTWRYYLPNDEMLEGWAVVFLDSTGCFTTVSDWGNYGYRWDHPGSTAGTHMQALMSVRGEMDFRAWLIARSDDYLLSKFAPEEIYDGVETRKGIEEYLAQQVREGRATPSWADEELATLRESSLADGLEEFWGWAGDTSLTDVHEFMRMRPHPQAVQFIKRVMPRLREAIREQLKVEAMDPLRLIAAGGGAT